ncbi:hypothetical protein LCGC14_1413950 [marine sediment metagenome]|uniref:Uncharacterized protein n=1 Tax=marine sediment metagenome TaxID=412755 RepID=A0A0F9JTE0_9ZZZZ
MGKVAVVHDALVILKDHGADVDISAKAVVIEFKDAFPQSCRIVLNARKGRFLTINPKIKKRDRIYVRIIEKGGKVTEDVFHVRKIKRKRIPGVGLGLELFCPHQSEHLWKRTISFKGRGKRISGNAALALIVKDINANKGASDPTIEIVTPFDVTKKLGNRFDPNTTNSYVFESAKAETAIEELKDIEAQPVEGGGSLEPMYVRYKSKYDHATGNFLDVVQLQAFEQGFKGIGGVIFRNIPTVTLKHTGGSTPRPGFLTLVSDEDPEEGTNLVAIGNKTTGSFTKEWMLYFGAKEVFDSARAYNNSATYKRGSLVVGPNGATYEAKQTTTGDDPPNGSFWEARLFEKPADFSGATTYLADDLVKLNDIAYKSLSGGNLNNDPETNPTLWRRINFAPTVDYSPLTKDKAQFFINALAGARFATTNNFKTAMIDPNVVIDDKLHPRMPVRLVVTNPTSIPIDHKIGTTRIPDAYMILVINPATGVEEGFGDFAGNDASGVPFAGNVAEYVDRNLDGTGFWRVFKGKQTLQDQEIFDWDDSNSWVKFPCVPTFIGPIPSQFVNQNGDCITFPLLEPGTRETIWVKGAYTLSELLGVGKVGVFRVGRQFECVHSVKFDTANSRIDAGNEEIIDELESATSAFFIKSQPRALDGSSNTFYVGLNFWSLHPLTSNSLPYGVVNAGEKINLPTMDLNNMDLTHKGISEWFGPGVEDYYPLQALTMWMRLSIRDLFLGFLDDLDADFVIGTYWVDRQMNVMLVEEPVKRNNKTLGYTANLNKMKPFQGVPGTSAFGIQADNPSGVVAFDPTEFLFGGIYTRDSFDKQGRYIGIRSRFLNKDTMKMSVDAWRYSKPLVATNIDQPGNKPDFNIEPMKFQKTSISLYGTLKNFILGIEQFLNFDRRKFTLDVPPGKKIDWGDPVYVTDTQAIDDADDGLANTVKVTADAITITVSKTKNAPAGIKKTIEFVRRLYAT